MAKLARAVMAAASRAASSLNISNHYLLQLLQSEIEYELSKHPSQAPGGLFGDFVVEWDDPKSEDLLLRRRNGSEEDVAVSSLLGPEGCRGDGTLLDMKASMKVCIAKPSLSSVLQFDCSIYGEGDDSSDFSINNVHYLPSVTHMRAEDYKGPSFSTLDPQLQEAFKEYLTARGIDVEFTNFLLLQLRNKEQSQYVNWLQRIESILKNNTES